MTIRVLTFTTLFPSETIPHHGVFVEQRLKHLLQSEQISSRVIAPVPWFPFDSLRFGEYARLAAIPQQEVRVGVEVSHPRYPSIPKVGMSVAPVLMALALFNTLRRCAKSHDGFDLIDAHYFYPDGVAAVILGRWLKKPVVITARGTDINLIPNYTMPRKWILWAAHHCAGIITVSDALRDRLLELGVNSTKVQTLRNGVDLELFHPFPDRDALRSKLSIQGPTLLSVGHLIERKGHHFVIEALSLMPEVRLIVVGDGEMRGKLERLAHEHGVAGRVRFEASMPHEKLAEYYNAADALVLASSREGMANVLLESIACGTPVLATPIWGSPEVVADSSAGLLLADRSAGAIVSATRTLLKNPPNRAAVREYAEKFSWDDTTRGQLEVFRNALGI